MTKFISPEGIEFPSKLEYYRTIEPQGTKSVPEFITYMKRKYDPTEREKHNTHCKHKKRSLYHTDEKYRESKIKSTLKRYHEKKIKFISITVN